MKKRTKFLIWIIVLVIIFGGFGFWFGINNPLLTKKLNVNNFYSTWMSNVKDETKLNNLVIPGSHDAGTYGMMPQAQTQGHTIKDQLNGGVRYFDIRVTNKGDDLVIFHGPIKGQKFSKVLNDFKEFINLNTSEFIIIDFQHLGDDCHDQTIKEIKDTLPMDKMLDSFFYPNINEITFKTIREQKANFMIAWKNDDEIMEKEALDNGFYPRSKALKSDYNGLKHREGNNSLIKQFNKYYENKDDDKLFVLQCQRTAKTLLGRPSMYEYSFNKKANEFIQNINKDNILLAKTNIIMRDYIVSDIHKVNLILRLNLDKQLIKEDKIEDYTLQVIR